jgi:signal transduction histidine kinase
MESRARELAVGLTVEVTGTAGKFEGDEQAVGALLANLVENSLDACRLDDCRDCHRVLVRADGDEESVRFEVEDDGMGMDRETQEKAFSLFFSSKGTGTGLGLFIADKIARAHGGAIDLESTPGEGTVFTVTLPRVRPPAAELPNSPMTKGTTINA